jgi:hypothetical protein
LDFRDALLFLYWRFDWCLERLSWHDTAGLNNASNLLKREPGKSRSNGTVNQFSGIPRNCSMK